LLRQIARLAALGALAIALLPAAALAQTADPAPGACLDFSSDAPPEVLRTASVVVVGTVDDVTPGERAVISPEFYLKGATAPDRLVLPHPDSMVNPDFDCEPANLVAGDRVLLVLGRDAGRVSWPGAQQLYILSNGQAEQAIEGGETLPEAELVESIRSETGQYSIPARTEDEGARLDWFGTVLPVGAAVVIVFGIGLVLMREWHRIDPS
jgi:hypothetical protein